MKKNNEDYVEPFERILYENRKKARDNLQTKSLNEEKFRREATDKKRKRKERIVGAVTGALATLIVIGMVKLGIDLNNSIKYHNDLKNAKTVLTTDLRRKLVSEGLDIDTVEIEDIPTEMPEAELYAYYCSFGDEFCNKVAKKIDPLPNDPDQTSSYEDGLTNIYYRLGYLDENGAPSAEVWENYMDTYLVESYRDGTLTLGGNPEKGRGK